MITLLEELNMKQELLSPALRWRYCLWLEQSNELFGHLVSNMGRLLYY